MRKDPERLDIEKTIDFFCNKAFLTQETHCFFLLLRRRCGILFLRDRK